jgi:hypothetical protein
MKADAGATYLLEQVRKATNAEYQCPRCIGKQVTNLGVTPFLFHHPCDTIEVKTGVICLFSATFVLLDT